MISPAKTLDSAEIDHFSSISSQWWDEKGAFKPLHHLNPTRIHYIRDQILAHVSDKAVLQDPHQPLAGISILDAGCGGGLVCEPLRRLGATMTGIDACQEAIEVAKSHAADQDLSISYQTTTLDEFSQTNPQFDVVLALEIVEHVADIGEFIRLCSACLRPGGLLILSTINRTTKSYVLAIIGAEYILNWVPKGTHHWSKFVTPAELTNHTRQNDITLSNLCGLAFRPISQTWVLDSDLDVNYFLTGIKETL